MVLINVCFPIYLIVTINIFSQSNWVKMATLQEHGKEVTPYTRHRSLFQECFIASEISLHLKYVHKCNTTCILRQPNEIIHTIS